MLMDRNILRETLRKLADAIADEAEGNPEFATVLAGILLSSSAPSHPNQEKRTLEHLRDPFEVYALEGEEGLRSWLESLSTQELRAIVRSNAFDPSRLSDKWKSKERFVALILQQVEGRTRRGSSFLHYGSKPHEPRD